MYTSNTKKMEWNLTRIKVSQESYILAVTFDAYHTYFRVFADGTVVKNT